MQQIFYNAKIFTNNENKDIAQAMLVNDGAVVISGSNEEVMQLKTDDTKLIDLKNKNVYPTFFCLRTNVFDTIDKKNAKQNKNNKKSDVNSDDYERFDNFETYKKAYLKIEKEFIKRGITTIAELGVDKRGFCFWKKMSDENLLSIDVVGYIDLAHSKQVMDDNCVTYRKYKNRFRLGGYYIKIDGKIQNLDAWLSKPYSGTKSHFGLSEYNGEQLHFLIKTALEERKQIIFEASGDKSIQEIVYCLNETKEKDKIENFYRPVILGAGVVHHKIFDEINKFDITLCLEKGDENIDKSIKRFVGFRRKKHFQNFEKLDKFGVKFSLVDTKNYMHDFNFLYSYLIRKKRKLFSKYHKNIINCSDFIKLFAKIFYFVPSYICFDQDTKMSLETEKQASFFVLDKQIFDVSQTDNFEKLIKSVYILGEKKY